MKIATESAKGGAGPSESSPGASLPAGAPRDERTAAPARLAAWQPAYLGVGSNLDEPRSQIVKAIQKLRELPGDTTRVIAVSKLYGSKPFGPIAQPDFVNAVIGILTQLTSPELLDAVKGIERALGRPEKYERWGPRIIDLDMLVYGREQRNDPALTIPHPGIVERNWVLYPLADIAPCLDIPRLGRVAALKSAITPEGVWPLE